MKYFSSMNRLIIFSIIINSFLFSCNEPQISPFNDCDFISENEFVGKLPTGKFDNFNDELIYGTWLSRSDKCPIIQIFSKEDADIQVHLLSGDEWEKEGQWKEVDRAKLTYHPSKGIFKALSLNERGGGIKSKTKIRYLSDKEFYFQAISNNRLVGPIMGFKRISIFVDIPGVPLIGQPNKNVCWAASTTMMLSWKHKEKLKIKDALFKVSYDKWFLYKRSNVKWIQWLSKKGNGNFGQLAPLEADDFYTKKVGLTGSSPEISITGIKSLLESTGPLLIVLDGNPNPDTIVSHVVVVTGIYGDGSLDETYVVYHNPLEDKKASKESFKDFNGRYQREVARNIAMPKKDRYTYSLFYFD